MNSFYSGFVDERKKETITVRLDQNLREKVASRKEGISNVTRKALEKFLSEDVEND